MGAQTRQVGGGAATGTANQFQGFLQQMMGGSGQQAQSGMPYMAQQPAGMPNQLWQHIQQQQNNAMQPQQQTGNTTGGMFGTLVNNAASGQVNDQTGAGAALGQQIAAGPQAGPQFQNPYTSQQFQGFNPSQLPTNFGGTGMADLSGFGNVGPTNFNVMQGYGQQGQSGFTNQMNQLMQQGGNMMQNGGGFQGVGAQNVSLAPATQIDTNNPYIRAAQQAAERQMMLATADNNARFGAEGASGLGTGAQFANSQLQAQYAPQLAMQIQQNIAQQQQQDLAERMGGANVGLQNAGNQLQAGIANQNAGLNAMGQQQNLFSNLLGAASTGRAQDFQNQGTNRGMDINQLGMGLNQAQGNQNAALTQQGQMMNAILNNQGMGNQFQQNNNQLNSQNQQLNNSNGMNMAGMQNQFNLNNAGNTAQYGLGTNQLNSQNYNQGMNNFLQSLGMGLGVNQLGNQNQQNLLGQLFGANMQATGIGTPQAQTISTPSAASQVFGALAPFATGLLMPGLGQFGGAASTGLQQMPMLPAFNPQPQNTTWGMGPQSSYTGQVGFIR